MTPSRDPSASPSPAGPSGPAAAPSYLRVSVTDRCNFSCSYCVPTEGFQLLRHEEILSYEEIVRIARVAVALGVRKIRVTGGEPLVRRGVEKLVGELASLEGLSEVCMTTNGSLLAKRAAGLKTAGLSRVTVSLDSLRPDRFERITGRNSLAAVLAGLEAALAAGLTPLKINTVLLAGVNDDELPEFAAFADRPGVQVRFIEYMPLGAGDWKSSFVPTADMEARLLAGVPGAVRLPDGPGAARRRYALPGGGEAGFIAPISEPFCRGCDRLRLTSSGALRACLIAEGEVDLKAQIRSGASDEELAASILRAFSLKPALGHGLSPRSHPACDRSEFMRTIGG